MLDEHLSVESLTIWLSHEQEQQFR